MRHSVDRDANRAVRVGFEDAYHRYRLVRAAVEEIRRELAALTASATSPDGLVTVTVDARGRLVGLELDPVCCRGGDSVALANAIAATAGTAATTAAQRVTALVASRLPADAGLVELLEGGDAAPLLGRHDDAAGAR
ncbi:YbaB/EbfC family nucleoid-associated protein [Pilimelia columellifera]|uniref:YbaB/EbfC DNA-binding family protein n=1 Tax=Pilimelia columellifera subsp. columellifera TaxID=706583 RepID=A0ABP6AUF1_9ACTN